MHVLLCSLFFLFAFDPLLLFYVFETAWKKIKICHGIVTKNKPEG